MSDTVRNQKSNINPRRGVHEQGTRPTVAPGKRTRAMSLRARPPGTGAPMQQKSDPALKAAQMKWSAETARWMPTAIRPDLPTIPVQCAAAGEMSEKELPSDGGGKAMLADVRAKMEGAFGADFSAVRIYEGPRSEALGARAFTQGTDVHFAPGEYQPESQSGQVLLGHELTHVVQQCEGRVSTTTQTKGVRGNDDAGLEAEADEMGGRAARGEPVHDGNRSKSTERAALGGAGTASSEAIAMQKKPRNTVQTPYLAHCTTNAMPGDSGRAVSCC